MIVRWPGVTRAGGECAEPVVLTDLFPTLLAAAGVGRPSGVPCDGLDLTPLLRDPGGRLARDMLFFHYPHYYDTTTPVSALRSRDWKLLEYAEDGHAELYRLSEDGAEARDLAATEPVRLGELRLRLHEWKQSVGAREVRPNPAYAGKR